MRLQRMGLPAFMRTSKRIGLEIERHEDFVRIIGYRKM
jgi:hypothetical protein